MTRLQFIALVLFLAFFTSGCKPDGKPLIQLQDYDKADTSNVHKDDKPMYRELTDEFGVKKGWDF